MRSDVRAVGGGPAHCVHPETVRHVQSCALPADDLVRVSAVFKLLADPTRCTLLYALVDAGELCVCDLAAATGVLEATVSQSLRLLRTCGVVAARREGRLMFYRLADAHARLLLDLTRDHITHDPSPQSLRPEQTQADQAHPGARPRCYPGELGVGPPAARQRGLKPGHERESQPRPGRAAHWVGP